VSEPAAEVRRFHRRLPHGRRLRDGTVLYWWAEIIFVLVFYFVYSAVRNANTSGKREAYDNAIELMRWQSWLGINHEQTLHHWALDIRPLIIASNYWYGSLHFVVTTGVLVFLFRKHSDDYPLWRNTIAISTAIALIGFAFWPLMPPRLLDSYYFNHIASIPHHFGFVDTLDKYPTFWSFKRGAVNKISNQFAAMPSVHCAWALWCTCALVPRLKHVWAKALAILYPICTVTAIVLTANHYFLDAVAGFMVLGVGYVLARIFTRAGRRDAPPTTPDVAPPSEPSAEPLPV
jgi:PAP2 superfamily